MTGTLHVVVGGSGGIGGAIVDELRSRGHRVRSVTRRGDPGPDGVEIVRADLLTAQGADDALRDAAVVYQAANPQYQRWGRDFPILQANVLRAAERSQAKIVMADNLYMYGPPSAPLREDTPHDATDAKGRLRARMAAELLEAHRSGRVRVVIGRSSDYFGPGGTNSAVGEIFFVAGASGKLPRWLGRLDQPHSLSYLPDTAAALVTLGNTDAGDGRAWHLPMQPAFTGREWADRLALAVDRPLSPGRISRPMVLAAGLVSPFIRELRGTLYQWERPWVVDDGAFRLAFGLSPTRVDEAIAATVAWVRARGHGAAA
jgi:nucleoside-diphosphate-sugar epimerase